MREKIRLMQFWLAKFQEVMTEHVTTGKMRQIELRERQTLAQQLKEAAQSLNPWG